MQALDYHAIQLQIDELKKLIKVNPGLKGPMTAGHVKDSKEGSSISSSCRKRRSPRPSSFKPRSNSSTHCKWQSAG